MHSGSDSAKAKSSGSGSTALFTIRTSFHYLLTGTCETVVKAFSHGPVRASLETFIVTTDLKASSLIALSYVSVVILQALQSALRGDSENVSCWEALADAYMARSVAECFF
jgi:hypothetical protein